jgi:hypothetical protein
MADQRNAIALVILALTASAARAEVTRVDIVQRKDIVGSTYEKLAGTVYFAVDPNDPHNRIVVDLDKAPRNAAGLVEFSADLYVVRPKGPAHENTAALVEVSNRGGRGALRSFNHGSPNPDPESSTDLGDGFLMKYGFTVASVGWEFDVADDPGLMRIHVPVATDGGKPITGVVRATFTPNAATPQVVVTDLAKYDAIDPDGPDSRLTVRSTFLGAGTPVALDRWRVSGRTVTLDGGFEPGKTYEVAYRAANPPVAGLGFVAVRDFATWLKHQDDSDIKSRYVYAFGSSQSGRFLRDFMYEGFNTDERNRQVFDGVMAHIAGAARINLNERWATPRGLGFHSATAFPFADASLRDPVSGVRDGLLENGRAGANQPKVFYTNTPAEYWGTGRVAALIHTTPDGRADVPLPENVRLYFLAGTQHAPARVPPTRNAGQQIDNPVDYWWTMRALVLAMHRWVSAGTQPPVSAYPTLANHTLVAARALAFPAIPGVRSPRDLTAGPRIANPLHSGGAGAGVEMPLLVPDVDQDGNEKAGIRLPDVAVPLETYTGWNFRHPSTGSPGELVSLLGSSIPFSATRATRAAANDPRRSIEERYASRTEYLDKVRETAEALVRPGYVLYDDIDRIVQRAGDTWDMLMSPPTHAADRPDRAEFSELRRNGAHLHAPGHRH